MAGMHRKIISVLQGWFFSARLRAHGRLGLPAQTPRERDIFRTLFTLMAADGKLRVFEWGCGLSTTYYAGFLTDKGIEFEWHALDNNRDWHERVKGLIEARQFGSRVHLHLEEFAPFWEKPGWGGVPPPCGAFAPAAEAERAYVDLPRRLGGTFDVMIVDARFRRRCIEAARGTVKPGGLVVLHDAQKAHYQEGLDAYPFSTFIESGAWYPLQEAPNQMWIGSLTNHPTYGILKAL